MMQKEAPAYILDTACGMLIVAAMSDRTVREAMEMITTVSLSVSSQGVSMQAVSMCMRGGVMV